MTREEYGQAYQKGFNLTVRFLVSRGLAYDAAQETAQAAWVKGWERLGQLRDSSMVLTWMNSIALNIHRSYIRREPLLQTLPELATPPRINLAAIDVRRILKTCKTNDRMVLQRHYLEGFKVQEIAQEQGWTETAVRIRLLRARRTVGKRLGRKYPESAAAQKLAAANASAAAAVGVEPVIENAVAA
ncbi:MAG: RNA polymerase sigma factor [Bryobacteraceae bacterium]|nr:RNA polymerase sigma factor [Bryobacteraceae bacterium]